MTDSAHEGRNVAESLRDASIVSAFQVIGGGTNMAMQTFVQSGSRGLATAWLHAIASDALEKARLAWNMCSPLEQEQALIMLYTAQASQSAKLSAVLDTEALRRIAKAMVDGGDEVLTLTVDGITVVATQDGRLDLFS